MIVFLVRKPTPVQAPGKDAIARISRQADAHVRQGRHAASAIASTLEAKSELDQALELDPANVEARRLRNLAVRAPEDEKLASAAIVKIGIGDKKALDEAMQLLDDTTDGTPAHAARCASKLVDGAGVSSATRSARSARGPTAPGRCAAPGSWRRPRRSPTRATRACCATPRGRSATARTCAAARP